MESDEEDFVFVGTPIEREDDVTTSRKRKSVAEASGNLRTLAPWKQEVRDEEGRRRFHGAFSGGFSAGYYNTVGSKEGWAPSTFTSSRKKRAEIKQQDVMNFLDEDEKAELEGNSLGTSMQYDTFGFTAAELVRKKAVKEQDQRPSAIPGPIPDEIIVPVTDSIGVRLMLKMGWRHGHSIQDSVKNSLYDARRQARKAFLAFSLDGARAQPSSFELVESENENVTELPAIDNDQFYKNTPVYVLNPKQDMHGLGFDPFKDAPEFREKKISSASGNKNSRIKKPSTKKDGLLSFRSERIAPGFGIGALEELDAEDEDIYASGYGFETTYVQEDEEPLKLAIEDKKKSSVKEDGALQGFKAARNTEYQLERFNPPVIPKDFVPYHKFPVPLEAERKLIEVPPSEAPPPLDANLKVLIEGVATLVARCGTPFEDLSREKNRDNPMFSFLDGGEGHAYYARMLWEASQKHDNKIKLPVNDKVAFSAKKMTAESRGKILGEKPLERSSRDSGSSVTGVDAINMQFNLSDTFTKPASFAEPVEVAKPFLHDPAKQERFEQFLKEKYQGGLRSKDSSGSSKLSEAARARERLEFEAAAVAIEGGQWGKESNLSNQQTSGITAGAGLQFTPAGFEKVEDEEMTMKKMFPKREEFQWRPAPILCKRFDLTDPYMGKPAPPPRMRSKMDSLVFMPDSVGIRKVEEMAEANNNSVPVPELDLGEVTNQDDPVKVENIERPVDLYKAIFSDDSEDEEGLSTPSQVEDPKKKVEEAANKTLNRLVADDFLESLGKELGVEVPPDRPSNYAMVQATENPVPPKQPPVDMPNQREDAQGGRSLKHGEINGSFLEGGGKIREGGSIKISPEKVVRDEKTRISSSSEDERSKKRRDKKTTRISSSAEDERNKKRSKHRRRHESSDSDGFTTDSSDDYKGRRSSRHKRRKRGSSREKHSSSRSHSKHHKHRSGDGSSRSSRYSSEKDYREYTRERRPG